MTNADEDALRVARPNVAVWIDKLRHAGHVICVRKRRGANPNAGFRIEVDGRVMTMWELWARFRSALGMGSQRTKRQADKSVMCRASEGPDCRSDEPGPYVFKAG